MVLAAVAAFAGASVQSATGFGFALILTPALFAELDSHEAITVVLALSCALNLLVLADSGPGPVRWRMLAPMLLAAIPGLALGAVVLSVAPKAALQITVGIAVIAAAVVQIRGSGHVLRGPGWEVGLVSGTLTTSIGVSGPPIVLWLDAHGLTPAQLRASLAAAFMALNLAGGAIVLAAGGAGESDAGTLLPLLALVLAGHVVGAVAFRRLQGPVFSRIVLGLVAAAGVFSVVAGLASL
jgi:uncharacterized membrane protein YfcA